jgi:hypothetical protein
MVAAAPQMVTVWRGVGNGSAGAEKEAAPAFCSSLRSRGRQEQRYCLHPAESTYGSDKLGLVRGYLFAPGARRGNQSLDQETIVVSLRDHDVFLVSKISVHLYDAGGGLPRVEGQLQFPHEDETAASTEFLKRLKRATTRQPLP